MNNPITILYAIQSELIARGIQTIWKGEVDTLSYLYIGCANDEVILQALSANACQVIVLDADYFSGEIENFIKHTHSLYPALKIVLIAEKFDRNILQTYRNGVCASFSKNDKPSIVRQVFQAVLSNQLYLPNIIIMNMINGKSYLNSIEEQLKLLSTKEILVLEQLSVGKRMKEVAALLAIAPSTLSTHKSRIIKKLNLETKKDLHNFLEAYKNWRIK